ncbi:MAG: dienelactone hydrolase family protein [Alphaproteobacteria bacterium]
MGSWIELEADDGHKLDAYRARPHAPVRGGLVVVQEVFGVNDHIRRVCDGFAADGYDVAAPALFDRIEKKVELGYGADELAAGRGYRTRLAWDDVVRDVKAATRAVTETGRVGVVGYCWGGSVAWLAATRLDVACAVGYYGGQIIQFKDEKPRCPVMLHFGEKDSLIPAADVAAIRAAQPEVTVHLYPAGHGFNCDRRKDFDPASADAGRRRTLAFFAEHLG